jgi:hypothetical protein
MGPAWLDDLLALVMVAIAVYEVGRLSVAWAINRPSERDVDVFHLAMGISMAGMLTGHLSLFAAQAWAVLFGAAAVWFACRVPWSVAASTNASTSLGHRLTHVVSSVAMVYMLLVMAPASGDHGAGAMGAMSMGVHRFPVAAVGLAVVLAVGVVFSAGHLGVGAADDETVVLDDVDVDFLGDDEPGQLAVQTTAVRARRGASRFLAPRSASAVEVAMGLVMAYMLLTLI